MWERKREANENRPLREKEREGERERHCEGKLMTESVDCVSMDEWRGESEGMEGKEMKR